MITLLTADLIYSNYTQRTRIVYKIALDPAHRIILHFIFYIVCQWMTVPKL